MRGFFWMPLGAVAGVGTAVVGDVVIRHHHPSASQVWFTAALCLWLSVAGMVGHAMRRVGNGSIDQEPVALVLLLIGGLLLPFVGWLFGVYLLWTSRVWTVKEKLTGTLVIPGGLIAAVAGAALAIPGGSGSCSQTSASVSAVCTGGGVSPLMSGSFIGIMAVLTIAPVFSALWLYRRLRPVVNPLS